MARGGGLIVNWECDTPLVVSLWEVGINIRLYVCIVVVDGEKFGLENLQTCGLGPKILNKYPINCLKLKGL